MLDGMDPSSAVRLLAAGSVGLNPEFAIVRQPSRPSASLFSYFVCDTSTREQLPRRLLILSVQR